MNSKELLDIVLNHASKNNFPDVHIVSGQKIRVRNKS
jgi:hypothetical protein